MELNMRPAVQRLAVLAFVLGAAWGCHGTTEADGTCSNPATVKLHVDGIADQWIVVYLDSVSDPDKRTNELVAKYSFVTLARYSAALKGFAAVFSESTLQALRCESGIDFIEQDAQVHPLAWGH
jgi:hypothetical protein